jgi:hypothetical protein
MLCVRQCLLLLSQCNSGIDTPYICMHYMFWRIAATVRYAEPLQLPFLLSAVPPYTGQCLHIGRALFGYIVYVMSLCYEMCYILKFRFLDIKVI